MEKNAVTLTLVKSQDIEFLSVTDFNISLERSTQHSGYKVLWLNHNQSQTVVFQIYDSKSKNSEVIIFTDRQTNRHITT